jgi:hypothetical protein
METGQSTTFNQTETRNTNQAEQILLGQGMSSTNWKRQVEIKNRLVATIQLPYVVKYIIGKHLG